MIDRLSAAAALAWLDVRAAANEFAGDPQARDRADFSPPAALAAALGTTVNPLPPWLPAALASLETDAVDVPAGERHAVRFARARFSVRLPWLGMIGIDLVVHDFGVSTWFDPSYAATGHVLQHTRTRLAMLLADAGMRLDAFGTREMRRGERVSLPVHEAPLATGTLADWVRAAELDRHMPPEMAIAIARVVAWLDVLERHR